MNLYKCEKFKFSYISSSFDEVKEFLFEKTRSNSLYKLICSSDSLNDFFGDEGRSPQVYNSNGRLKALFFKSQSAEGIVMISNVIDGWESLCFQLSKSIRGNIYIFHFDCSGSSDMFNGFSLLADGINVRTVYAMKDPKWKFFENGDSLWFEDRECYKKRIISERVNKPILKKYCNSLNLNVEDDNFWRLDGESLLFGYTPSGTRPL
ncbi:hypothetical protein [Paraburkholderia sp. MM5482-R1]|uniref:hypothetical protein n=1 Tax=unclassified Paraburkholderia TaxID=2615204 RepID=UPI003D1C65B4